MSKLREQNMPDEDLSDLGAPAKPRGAGLADLVGDSTAAPPRTRPTPVERPAELDPSPTQLRSIPTTQEAPEPPVRARRPGRPRSRVRPVTAVYVSPGVKDRFEKYRHKQKATNLQVVLEAISAMHAELAGII
jgi:hypothetical protein